MGDFIYFTDEQKERANSVAIMDILTKEHEEVERAGNEWRWKRHSSVTFRGNSWYRHSQQIGSHAIDFMQEFFGMSYPEAVTYLLDGETGQVISAGKIISGEKAKTEQTKGRKQPQTKTGKEKIGKELSDKNAKHGRRQMEQMAVEVQSAEMLTEKRNSSGQSNQDETGNFVQPEQVEPKTLIPPLKNDTMKRVYAYLMQKRHINREVLSYFARAGTLYESAEHHNAVFAGVDKDGKIRHIHKKGTCSDGKSFRVNEDGSDSSYGFGHTGTGNKLYVFEAPLDFLSFLTLYPKNWQENSYIVLNGVSEHAMLQTLRDNPQIDTVILCLDHDPAGIEACSRLAEILRQNHYSKINVLQSKYKDWNEDLKALHGEEAIPAKEHPKIVECGAWISDMKKVAESMNSKYATQESICKYYQEIYYALKKGNTRKNVEDAFDFSGMLLSAVLVRCMEKGGQELGKEVNADVILNNLQKRYRPHRDKGNFNTRLKNMQRAYEEIMEIYHTRDLRQKENKELLIKKCMSLTMECIKAHIFVAVEYTESQSRMRERREMEQREATPENTSGIREEESANQETPEEPNTQERGMRMECSQL